VEIVGGADAVEVRVDPEPGPVGDADLAAGDPQECGSAGGMSTLCSCTAWRSRYQSTGLCSSPA
jgi:hypothetical protein